MMKKMIALLLLLMLVFPALAEDKDNRYDGLGPYGENGMMPVQCNGLWGIVDATGRQVVPCEWEDVGTPGEMRIPVERDGLWGCVDLTGCVVVEPVWDSLSVWSDGTLKVRRDGWAGLLSADGEVIVPCGQYTYVGWNIDGYILVQDARDRWGKLNPDGSVAIPLEWWELGYFHDGLAYAKRMNDRWRYINTAGETAFDGSFIQPGDFKDGLALVEVSSGGCRFIDTTGTPLTPDWDDAEEFSCGLALVKRDGLYGYIDCTGEVVIPLQFTSASSFVDGVALVRRGEERIAISTTGETFYGCPFEKAGGTFRFGFIWVMQGGQYGLMNTAGELVVPCEWDEYVGMPFLFGDVTAMKKDGELGFVNRQGELVTGQRWDEARTGYAIDGEYLYLLEDGVLTIWNADGTQVY